MTSQPDKLFRDKLENFQRPAPAGAWNKIEQNISKPKRAIVWLRAAAGIALLTTAAILIWPTQPAEQQITKVQDSDPVKANQPAQTPAVKEEPALKKEVSPKHSDKQITPAHAAHKKTVTPSKEVQKKNKEFTTDVHDAPDVDVPQTNTQVAERVTPEVKQPVSTVIVYTADEVNAKFLKKKLPPEATPESKEASGIQKLIGLAYAAKNSEAGLGDLRQKKDDLFAFSFGKKKSEN
jgi:cytoskeletal protein RodZ